MPRSPFDDLAIGCAVVFGGSGGLGAEIARKFASVGSNVVFSYRRRAEQAEIVREEISALGVTGLCRRVELSDLDSIDDILFGAERECGSIHTLVFATGPSIRMVPIAELPPAEWASAVAADVMGLFNVCHKAIPFLRRSKGSIVALSTAGTKRYPTLDVMSAGPKAAVEMLIKGVAREEGRNGIRANAVGVGQIEAGLSLELMADPRFRRLAERVVSSTPLRRYGTAEEVANVVLFLASSLAAFVSGEVICVDGGGHI